MNFPQMRATTFALREVADSWEALRYTNTSRTPTTVNKTRVISQKVGGTANRKYMGARQTSGPWAF